MFWTVHEPYAVQELTFYDSFKNLSHLDFKHFHELFLKSGYELAMNFSRIIHEL